ncbi:hypothetical protein HYT55_05875 [Candidatus Woesearchaeota archaeon]|nr:hypothetical protein [Candidatus Woesearchaeota archaeon]
MTNTMVTYTPRQQPGLDILLAREQPQEQAAASSNQFYDQVIATQRQIAGKDYQAIVSGLSAYDFQGTLAGVKMYTKKEQKYLSLEDLACDRQLLSEPKEEREIRSEDYRSRTGRKIVLPKWRRYCFSFRVR